ncbi:MAG: hypothetical protein WKF84_25230 [Pyrinomonadaceae bacterium]
MRGITADPKSAAASTPKRVLSLITALNPHVGYQRAADIAKEMLKSRRSAREVTREMGLMDDDAA